MKFTTASSLLGLAAPAVLSQDYNQTGPFALKLANSANETLNGQYLFACHAGAAIEGLCIGGTNRSSPSAEFFLNTTGENPTGLLIWNLPIQLPDSDHISEPMILSHTVGSNVAVPLFQPANAGQGQAVGFGDDDMMFLPSFYNDATFQPEVYPTNQVRSQLSQWHTCWAFYGGYYHQGLAWVTAGAPHNPTCEPVDVRIEETE